jgi:hypothetical protein
MLENFCTKRNPVMKANSQINTMTFVIVCIVISLFTVLTSIESYLNTRKYRIMVKTC